jgi:tetratricopeptide (TPR) repeat protein
MKRTERHHLKEDQIVTGFQWFAQFYRKWQREILIFAGALVFAAAVFGALFMIRTHGRTVQSRLVGEVLSLSSELNTNPESAAKLEKLAEGGRTARLANLELASYWAGRGDVDKSETFLGRIGATPKDLLYYQARDLEAQVLMRKKEYDKAVAIYKAILDEKPATYPLDAALYHLAEAYEAQGDKTAALDAYQKLQADYAQSYFAYEASLKAGRLGLSK